MAMALKINFYFLLLFLTPLWLRAQINSKADTLHSSSPSLPLTQCEEEPFKKVEQMPIFAGCDLENLSEEERQYCSQKKMLTYFYKNFKTPRIKVNEPIPPRRVITTFVVNKIGKVERIEIIRGAGSVLDEEIYRVLNEMPLWMPGK